MELTASSFAFSQWLFLKLLAVNYFFAFGSLLWQMKGLYGENGILPVKELLANIVSNHGKKLFFRVPTIFWWDASDRSLQTIALLGMIASVLVIIGIIPAPLFLFMWLAYLSFTSVGSTFLSFQWDTLLLEVGFLGIFFAIQTPPPLLLVFAAWFLLFRFMFSSGVIKLLSKCPEWKAIKAMDFHYETQPIPNRLAYYIHQLPKVFGKITVIIIFLIELFVPFLIFAPGPLRLVAFFILVLFQIIIMLTGNYAFFNTLTITLCFLLLNDFQFQELFTTVPSIYAASPYLWLEILLSMVAVILIFFNALQLVRMFLPSPIINKILNPIAHFEIVNSYGLFARMTTVRNEIIIEGSQDGQHWLPYEFKWKPGDLTSPPPQVAPYHPRLDWQMWFAALSSYQHNPWFLRFLVRILEGKPEVLNLLKSNPFPNEPPKYLRSLLYQYHFSDLKTKKEKGEWWTRTLKGTYSPSCTLQKNQTP